MGRMKKVTSHNQSGGITGFNVNVEGAPSAEKPESKFRSFAYWATAIATVMATAIALWQFVLSK